MRLDPAVVSRITRAANFHEPDRVPIWESLQNTAVYNRYAPGVPFPECAAIACQELGIDATYGCMEPVEGTGTFGTEIHAAGTVWRPEPSLRLPEDLAHLLPPEPDANAIEDRALAEHERMQQTYGSQVMYLPQTGGFGFLPGYDTQTFAVLATAIAEDISSAARLWDRRMEHAIIRNEVIARNALTPIVQCCEDVAYKTGLMVSPEMLRSHFFPRLRQVIAPLKAAGIKAIWHSDGNITDVLDDAVECGIDGINPVDTSAGMDIGAVKKLYAQKLILVGNVGTNHVLSLGTPGEVREDVRRCIRAAAKGGGHFLQCADGQVMPDCPLENVTAYCDEAHRFGRYPIPD